MKYIHHMPKVRPTPASATSAASTDQPWACTTADTAATVPMMPSPSAMMVSRP